MTAAITIESPETFWAFHGSDLRMRWGRGYEETLDPFPGYSHDADRVREALDRCAKVAPLPHAVRVWLPSHEPLSRTTAWTSYSSGWQGEGDDQVAVWEHHIVLSGKRVPIHPALTDYVVPHEYAHALLFEAAAQRGVWNSDELMREYADLRGVECRRTSGGRWHDGTEEIAACDFRVLIAQSEVDYWPHPGIASPCGPDRERLAAWWRTLIAEVNAGGDA